MHYALAGFHTIKYTLYSVTRFLTPDFFKILTRIGLLFECGSFFSQTVSISRRYPLAIHMCKKLCGVINTKESTLVVLKLDSVIDTVESLCLACVQPKVRLGSND